MNALQRDGGVWWRGQTTFRKYWSTGSFPILIVWRKIWRFFRDQPKLIISNFSIYMVYLSSHYVFSYIKHTTIQAKFNNGNLNEIGGETTYSSPPTPPKIYTHIILYGNCFNIVIQLFYVGYNAIWNFSVVIYFILFCMQIWIYFSWRMR